MPWIDDVCNNAQPSIPPSLQPQSAHQAPLVWRVPAGPQGLGAVPVVSDDTTPQDLTPPPAKLRMQFDWVKIQQGVKTLQFQRSDFRI